MSKQRYFITGTDTEVGKTLCTAAMMTVAKSQGMSTLGLKPISAGCEETKDGLRNEDATTLMAYSTVTIPYEQVNPIAFAEPIAPHIIAERHKKPLSADRTTGYVRGVLMMNKVDLVCVEGAGGWRMPLNLRETFADVARQLQHPVILVVGVRLGCLNHALLTVEAIKKDGLPLAGWIANIVEDGMSGVDENIDTLQKMIPAPCLGIVPFITNPTPESVAENIHLPGDIK